jgi:glucose dehydrogenase
MSPTATANPAERPWPTQPIPFKANGEQMSPVSPVTPTDIPPEWLATRKIVPHFTPIGPNQIFAPGTGGGANYGALSYSPRTGLLYVNAIDAPVNSPNRPRGFFSAFDPATGELAWQQIYEGYGQAGSVVTAGDIVFVGSGSNVAGYFYAFDAKTGKELWKFNTGSGVFSSPTVYRVNGRRLCRRSFGWRRSWPARRRPHPQLRASEELNLKFLSARCQNCTS